MQAKARFGETDHLEAVDRWLGYIGIDSPRRREERIMALQDLVRCIIIHRSGEEPTMVPVVSRNCWLVLLLLKIHVAAGEDEFLLLGDDREMISKQSPQGLAEAIANGLQYYGCFADLLQPGLIVIQFKWN